MLHLEALKHLKVTSVRLEVVTSLVSGTIAQVRLSGTSETLPNGMRVAGEIAVYPDEPHTMFRMFRSGLFEATIGLGQTDFDRLWQACSMPHEIFNASLELPGDTVIDGDHQEVALRFTYQISRGKPAWQDMPSDDWIV